MTSFTVNSKEYVHDKTRDGYYGLKVVPGSAIDTTMGKVGIAWRYLQYAPEDEVTSQMRADNITAKFTAIEQTVEQTVKTAKEKKSDNHFGLCPKCKSWCYGDCEA